MARQLERRFFRLALINILSNVTVPLAGLVDTAMLGHLDDIRYLAGVALAAVLFDYVYWSFGFLRMGTTGMTAQAAGRGEQRAVHLVLVRSIVIALSLAAGLLLFQLPIREAGFALLAGDAGVEAAGRDYFNARIWAAPATLTSMVLVGWFLGREQSRIVLVMTVVANVSNVVFNYIFILRMGLAAQGAGLATMVSQYVMLVVGLMLYRAQGRAPAWSWPEVLDRKRLAQLFRLNRDILVRTLFLVTSFAIFVNISSMMGVAVLAANSLLLRLQTLAAYLIDGAAFASESLAGHLRGRGDASGLRRLVRLSLFAGVGFATLFLVPLFVAPRAILGMLTSHPELVDLAVTYVPWLAPVLLLGALAYMYDGLFLGLTEGPRLRNAMAWSTLAVFVPAAIAAAWLRSNHVLWGSMAVFMAARTVTLGLAGRTVLGGSRSGG